MMDIFMRSIVERIGDLAENRKRYINGEDAVNAFLGCPIAELVSFDNLYDIENDIRLFVFDSRMKMCDILVDECS